MYPGFTSKLCSKFVTPPYLISIIFYPLDSKIVKILKNVLTRKDLIEIMLSFESNDKISTI